MGTVSMATDGAVGIEGGNFQVFENFLKRSGAGVHLNTKVHRLFIDCLQPFSNALIPSFFFGWVDL